MQKKADICNIGSANVQVFLYKSVIVGGGCAGLNCADTLFDLGERDIALITNSLSFSTSINTGSDKQTYYKLSTAGGEQDSVQDMAKTLFSGGCTEGFHCLTEAAMSLKCFYKLIRLGVDFPQNEYGEYVGYRTDHDLRRRATSCGPLTSKFMAEALIRSVKGKDIDIIENKRAAKLIVEDKKVRGVICVDTKTGEISVYLSPNVVLATGGPSGIYRASVYPACHSGALSLALEAGCEGVNLTEWQYGIASTDFRWNLSGSFMQVIPRFVSVDENGNEFEFLHDYLGEERYDLIFQKGYNWPFCPTKLSGENKSSLVDLAVYREVCKGRKVYLDFTKNDSLYDKNHLCAEAREYLESCGVLHLDSPIQRLVAMNDRAYRLYLDKAGIDLKTTPLAIDVCAQHNNGGIDCDVNYETCIKGLYASGECAGIFGVARPGGTALNSTQVSSMRAAEHIKKSNRQSVCLNDNDKKTISDFLDLCTKLTGGTNRLKEVYSNRKNIAAKMSECASFVRIAKNIDSVSSAVERALSNFEKENAVCDKTLLFEVLTNRDILLSAKCVLSAMREYAARGFKSRGSYLVLEKESDIAFPEKIMPETDTETLIKVHLENGQTKTRLSKVSQIPESEQWFEKVYNAYYEK